MSVDHSALERFALASSAERAQLLADERGGATREAGACGLLRQAQLHLIEARQRRADAAQLAALESAELTLATALRESRFASSHDAQALLRRSDLLRLESAQGEVREQILQRFKDAMGVGCEHYAQQLPAYEASAEAAARPSTLDPSPLQLDAVLSKALLDAARQPSGDLSNVTQLGWEWLAHQPLTRVQLAQLLQRQQQPVLSNLVELVARELTEPVPNPRDPKHPQVVRFGEQSVHRAMTLAQLQALRARLPNLYAESRAFAEALLLADVPFVHAADFEAPTEEGGLSDEEKRAYVEQLWKTAGELPPAHASLKGLLQFHVLYYSWQLFSEIDFARLQAYLELPRTNAGSSALKLRSDVELGLSGLAPADLNERRACLFLPSQSAPRSPVSHVLTKLSQANEQELLEFALRRLLRDMPAGADLLLRGPDAPQWTRYLQEAWSRRVAATAALTHPTIAARLSPAEADELRAQLDASELARLKSQVLLEFGSEDKLRRNKATYGARDAVALHLRVKGVQRLVAKVFVLNARNFYLKKGVEIDAANLELDGLTPKEEHVIDAAADGVFSDFHIHERTLTLDSLSRARRGVFVVELLGGGYRARAIVRKGAIAALSSLTPQGHVFRLVDSESATPLLRSALVLGGQTYTANEKSGFILVPYSSTGNSNQSIVLMGALPPTEGASASAPAAADASGDADDATFATLSSFAHLQEQYSFHARLFVDREALLAKSRATVLVRAELSLHGQTVSVQRALQKAVLRIDTVDDEGVPSTQLVDPFPLTDDAESTHAFAVPDNLSRVTLTLSGEVVRNSRGDKQQVSDSWSCELNALETTNFVEDIYLKFGKAGKMRRGDGKQDGKQDDDGDALMSDAAPAASSSSQEDEEDGAYSLFVLGKSGEPVPHRRVRIQLRHQFLQQPLAAVPKLDLATDAAGCIRLGRLPHVYELTAVPVGVSSTSTPQQHRWPLMPPPHRYVQSNSKSNLIVREGEALVLPYTGAAMQLDKDALQRGDVFVLAEDRGAGQLGRFLTTEHVSLVSSASERAIKLTGLRAGHYAFLCKKPLWQTGGLWHWWNVHVVAGPVLLGEFVRDAKERRFLQLDKAEVRAAGRLAVVRAAADAAGQELVIQLSGVTASTRVHVLSTHFLPEYPLASRFIASPPDARVLLYSLAASSYMRQKRLGDEVQYVLDRRVAAERVGNMLPRPSLLLHERVKQSTQMAADPTLSAGEQYGAADVAAAAPPPRTAMASSAFGAAAPAQAMMMRAPASIQQQQVRAESGFGGFSYLAGGGRGSDDGGASVGIVAWDGGSPQARHGLEFLASPSTLLVNLRPAADGTVRIPLSAFERAHNQVSIVALDSVGQVATARYALKDASVPLLHADASLPQLDAAYRDSRLLSALDATKCFSEFHLITCLRAGETLRVADAKTSAVEAIDSLGDVWTLAHALAQSGGFGSLVSQMAEFDWLLRWPTLSAEQQDAKYSEFACHELHLFLATKDRPFFARVVQPFLRNKLQKTFVDLALLEADVSGFLQPHAFDMLNTYERILLAQRLHASGTPAQRAQATSILELICQTELAGPRPDAEQVLSFFKAAMSSKSVSKKANADAEDARGGGVRGGAREKKQALGSSGFRPSTSHPGGGVFGASSSAPPPPPARAAMKMKKSVMRKMDMREEETEEEEQAEESAEFASFDAPDADEDSFDSFAADLHAEGGAARKLFTSPPTTKEYEERNYYAVSSSDVAANAELVEVNQFWAAYARHLQAQWASQQPPVPFLTRHAIDTPLSTLTELLLRLSVLELPLPGQGAEHSISDKRERSLTFKANAPVIVLHREMRAAEEQQQDAKGQEASGVAPASSPSAPAVRRAASAPSVSVSSTYFDPLDLYSESVDDEDGSGASGERIDKYVSDEFLTRKIYGCRVVLTNVSSSRQRCELLLQLPEGALPVGASRKRGLTTATRFVDVASYSSSVQTYLFYFPAAGNYPHYPPSASRQGRSVGAGVARTLRVVERPTVVKHDARDWKAVSQTGSNAEVLQFLRTQNLLRCDLSMLCWRLQPDAAAHKLAGEPRAFFGEVTALLRSRLLFTDVIWRFALVHGDLQALGELLQRSPAAHAWMGGYFESGLVRKDAIEFEWSEYTHLEYAPLLNARAHTLRIGGGGGVSGGAQKAMSSIQNLQFSQQWAKFLTYLSERISGREQLSDTLRLQLTYYLLLQDRVEEAQKVFNEIAPPKEAGGAGVSASSVAAPAGSAGALACTLQYDYARCFFSFFSSDPSAALPIARRYAAHPVAKKRKLFAEVENQLLELAGALDPRELEDAHSADPQRAPRDALDRDRELSNLAASAPSLDLHFASQSQIEVRHANLRTAQLNFSEMNVELMFSASPFLIGEGGAGKRDDASGAASADGASASFLFVTPNLSMQLALPQVPLIGGVPSTHGAPPLLVDIPARFRATNCWVELTDASPASSGAGGLSVVRAHFAHQLAVQLTANYGQVKVAHAETGKPLPGTYVKVYSRPKGMSATASAAAATFFKDGYTDLRGRFDYASLSTDKLGSVAQFALLILHKNHGAVVKLADPPQQ